MESWRSGDVKIISWFRLSIRLYNYDFTGESPLHEAAYYGHLEVTRMLLDADDIEINLQDNKGKYLSHISIQSMNISLSSKYWKL